MLGRSKWAYNSYVRTSGKPHMLPEYSQWCSMRNRCKLTNTVKYPTYSECSYHVEWESFDSYMQWATKQVGFLCRDETGKLYALDKDVLRKGNKKYCPEYCVFLPPALNAFLGKNKAKRGLYPIGVRFSKEKGRFKAEIRTHFSRSVKFLGYYSSPEEAFLAYKSAKQALAKELAIYYKGQVDDRVLHALNNFNVEIGD